MANSLSFHISALHYLYSIFIMKLIGISLISWYRSYLIPNSINEI